MGQKVNPVGLRVGIIRDWDSKWYAKSQDVKALIKEDHDIRKLIANEKDYQKALISHVEIERLKGKNKSRIIIKLYTAKPGVVIGTGAETKNKVVKKLEKLTNKEVFLNVVEIKKPERNAQIMADQIALQLENRASFRRAQKQVIQRAMRSGALGCKTSVSGRLGGAEMARTEGYSEGRVPLQTLRADVDYATSEAKTTYGILGVKVWIYNGEVLKGETREENIKKFEDKVESRRGGKKRPTSRRTDRASRKAEEESE